MQASLAAAADVASWLEIVAEVEPLFGPMPNFETRLLRKIDQGAALCVRAGDSASVLGGVLLSAGTPNGWIRWLAVRSSARGSRTANVSSKEPSNGWRLRVPSS
jgi:hypothetical protein